MLLCGRYGNWGPAGRNDLPFNHSTIIEELLTVYSILLCIDTMNK